MFGNQQVEADDWSQQCNHVQPCATMCYNVLLMFIVARCCLIVFSICWKQICDIWWISDWIEQNGTVTRFFFFFSESKFHKKKKTFILLTSFFLPKHDLQLVLFSPSGAASLCVPKRSVDPPRSDLIEKWRRSARLCLLLFFCSVCLSLLVVFSPSLESYFNKGFGLQK